MKLNKIIFSLILPLVLISFSGCGPGNSKNNDNTLAYDYYDQSDTLSRYSVSSKLLNTLFKGVDPTIFFEKGGKIDLGSQNGDYSLQAIRQKLDTSLTSREVVFLGIDDFYSFDTRGKPLQYPITTLYEMPLSRDYFNFWMAYVLSNTILFSPAVELDSVDELDAQRVYHRLVTLLDEGKSISAIVYEHMTSQENWRRFRSPEDNTREMMEIFLGRFKDEEVPLAAKACQNWYLSDDSQGYQLVKTFNVNETPQSILETEITTCEDFYHRVSTHPSLMPRIIRILVDYFYDGYSEEAKSGVVSTLAAENFASFRELFIAIIFSESYLYENPRAKKFEEVFLGTAQTIQWSASNGFFRDLNRDPSSTTLETLLDMNQGSMRYKLGRPGSVPLDSLSFSYVHKSVRDRLFLDRKTNEFSDYDGGWQADFIDIVLGETDFTDYFFVSLLGREATDEEKSTLESVFVSEGIEENTVAKAVVIMDYVTRLTELYYFR